MKISQYILAVSLFILPWVSVLAEEDEFDSKIEQKLVDPLGKDIVDAISKSDKEAFLKCWVTTDELVAYLSTLPEDVPVPKGDQLLKFREYFNNTRKVVSSNFDLIQKSIKDQGIKPSQIVFERLEVKYEMNNKIRMITSAKVVFKHADIEYFFEIDDALKIGGFWKFSDKPAKVVKMVTQQK